MNWQEVVEHPSLRDLPFKIELNEYGAIVMNPVKLNHSGFQRSIQALMENQRDDGMALPEVAVWTRKGTKVADVAWVSLELWKDLEGKTALRFFQ
jgi:hypothetical protein